MRRCDIAARGSAERPGLCHLAFGCRSREEVLALTERLRAEGRPVVGEPRTGGDGYFESVVEDPGGMIRRLRLLPLCRRTVFGDAARRSAAAARRHDSRAAWPALGGGGAGAGRDEPND